MKRKSLSKKIREQVWEKYNHHCAYCGCELEYKDMQVDHFIAVQKVNHGRADEAVVESFDNYMPACRSCNYYKRARGIESMRKDIARLYKQLDLKFDYRFAKKYQLISETPHKIKFYFEEFENKH